MSDQAPHRDDRSKRPEAQADQQGQGRKRRHDHDADDANREEEATGKRRPLGTNDPVAVEYSATRAIAPQELTSPAGSRRRSDVGLARRQQTRRQSISVESNTLVQMTSTTVATRVTTTSTIISSTQSQAAGRAQQIAGPSGSSASTRGSASAKNNPAASSRQRSMQLPSSGNVAGQTQGRRRKQRSANEQPLGKRRPFATSTPASGKPSQVHKSSVGSSQLNASSIPPESQGQMDQGSGLTSSTTNPKPIYEFGNYPHYYGYRNAGADLDPRVAAMNSGWFEGKRCLDIGCNVGAVTINIARAFRPRQIDGIDLDPQLIERARRNVNLQGTMQQHQEFPISFPLCLGPVVPPTHRSEGVFPANIAFHVQDFVQSDECEENVYDVILCLSVAKWVQLNHGDAGLQRLFSKALRMLKPGGLFLLEAQPWSSYRKKRNLTENIKQHFHEIKLHPKSFARYLVDKLGFDECEDMLLFPAPQTEGFDRPIQVFRKPVVDSAPVPSPHVFVNHEDDDFFS